MEKQIKSKKSGKSTTSGVDIPTFCIALETLEEWKKIRVQIKEEAADGQGASDPEYTNSPLYVTCRDAVELGRILYNAVFIGAIRERFEAYRSTLEQTSPGGPVRLRLLLEIQTSPTRRDPLFNLPWELLHDGHGFLALDHNISIARRPIGVQAVEQPVHPPLRVLAAYATPQAEKLKGVKPSDGEAYLQSMIQALQEVKPLDLRPLPHATKQSLREALAREAHVFHFLGHGDVEIRPGVGVVGRLYLENPDTPDLADVLTSTTLRDWFNQSLFRPNLVIITACRSARTDYTPDMGVAQSLLYAGIPAVIGMQADVYVHEACQFTSSFYRVLAERATVDDAMLAARKSLAENQSISLRGGVERVFQRMLELKQLRIHYTEFAESLASKAPIKGFIPFPAWAVPVLFLQGSGWLGQEPPQPEIKWKRDGKTMVYIEEGRFYVDKYPVTCEEYQRFVNETGRVWYNPWKDKENWEKLPATNVTLEDALAYAKWAGKHLPTLEEWQQAALAGSPDKERKYPWGDEFLAGRCNTLERGLGRPWSVMESEANNGCNAVGVYDVVGNVAEWVIVERHNTSRAMVCGGSYQDPGERCTVQQGWSFNPEERSPAVGFRCAASWAEVIAQNSF